MTDAKTPKGEWRYRAYFRLMDASLFFWIVLIIDTFVSPYDDPDTFPVWYAVHGEVTIFFCLFVSLFLVFARFMRDDYAEGLRKRTFVLLGYGAVVGPIFINIGSWVIYYTTLILNEPGASLDGTVPQRAPDYIRWLLVNETTVDVVLGGVSQVFLGSFIAIFRFLRWKDSR